MKFRPFALILIAALLFAGCGASAPGNSGPGAVATQPQAVQPKFGASAPALTKEQAQAIALAHAGLTADQVTYLRAEYEVDDGVPQYEVEFHQGRWEYDYEIHAGDGTILSYNKGD